ncbi:Hsp20/alpha crystallin family protein [Pseudonocardia zijingensis]|jgi:HSP20 family protein|uniref:Hsp20/alpha crystallin family protein n=1 Tax=Pseudonocardia zijingensis TaxID=153376 RepID=A0ABN1NYK7_9PSEU
MSSLIRRDRGGDVAGRFNRMDRIFDEWMRSLPMRRPFGLAWDWPGDDLIRVDEYRDGDTEVIRAELPGIDPEKDVELTVADGMLRINAERRIEDRTEDKGYLRHELRYGSMSRTLPLPDGVSESDISATYQDGILEIRVPVPERPQTEPTKIAIKKR